jgi:5-(aminomethyl)-3-furanmethanol phosphate kinase
MHDFKTVVKVGGSLFDWPELGQRLELWLNSVLSRKILLVPGGGPTADLIRSFDRLHGLGEETAHWLALRALTVNAHLLRAMLSPFQSWKPVVVADLQEVDTIWARQGLPILDPFSFVQIDEYQPGRLPHSWSATSDSLAARVAVWLKAGKLVLLKSAEIPHDWMDAARGIVDSHFENMIHSAQLMAGLPLSVSAVNLREWNQSPERKRRV